VNSAVSDAELTLLCCRHVGGIVMPVCPSVCPVPVMFTKHADTPLCLCVV